MNVDYKKKIDKASEYINLKKYTIALKMLEKLTIEYPEYYKAYQKIGFIYSLLRQWEKAINFYDEAISRNDKEPMLYFSRARYLMQNGNFKLALLDIDYLLILEHKNNSNYYVETSFFLRGIINFNLGNYKEAILDCKKVRDDFVIYILGEKQSKEFLIKNSLSEINLLEKS